MKRTLIALAVLLWLVPAFDASAQKTAQSRRLTLSEIKEIKDAVQDEIYDYEYYGNYYQIAQNVGTPTHWVSRPRIYINPMYNTAEGHGEIIYKLMPYGQVYRLFFLSPDKGVQLDGNSQNHFPITQPSHLTVYMDEEEVCRLERMWLKEFFTIDTAPSSELIEQASKRQKVHSGFSFWENKHETDSVPQK